MPAFWEEWASLPQAEGHTLEYVGLDIVPALIRSHRRSPELQAAAARR